jgi:hypothetical protein
VFELAAVAVVLVGGLWLWAQSRKPAPPTVPPNAGPASTIIQNGLVPSPPTPNISSLADTMETNLRTWGCGLGTPADTANVRASVLAYQRVRSLSASGCYDKTTAQDFSAWKASTGHLGPFNTTTVPTPCKCGG